MLAETLSLATRVILRARGARPTRLAVEGYALRVWTLGPQDGEPWLLLHGLGSTAVSWLPLLGALRRDCRLIAPELSALGGTRGPRPGLDVAAGVRAAAALIERHFAGRPVTVCGASLGGWMSVRLALARPELVGRLLLIDCAGYRDQDWERIERTVRLEAEGGIAALQRALFARRRTALALARPAFRRVYSSPAVRSVLDGLRQDDAFDDRDLARLAAPVGLLWGELDGLFPLATAEAMARALASPWLSVLAGCGHVPHWEAPRRLGAAVTRFRAQVPPAGAMIGSAA